MHLLQYMFEHSKDYRQNNNLDLNFKCRYFSLSQASFSCYDNIDTAGSLCFLCNKIKVLHYTLNYNANQEISLQQHVQSR